MLNIPWRTGVNMREFAYYNTSVRPLPPASLQRDQLIKLKEMKVKLVRFYASAADLTTAQCVTQVRKALDLLDEFDMQAIVCLDDSLGSGFSVPGTGGLHSANGHYDKSYWGGLTYNTHYIPHVTEIVTQFADHPAVMIWELGNEYALHPNNPPLTQADIDAFFNFAKVASETIKALSPERLVSTGFLNSRQISYALNDDNAIKAFAKRLYSLPSIDVICIHYYKQDDEKQFGLFDTEAAMSDEVKKPFYIGEIGALRDEPDRPGYYGQEIQEWKDAGAFSVLPWAFDVHNVDANIGDDKAMSRQFQNQPNADFDALCGVVQGFGVEVDRFFAPMAERGVHIPDVIPEGPVKFFTVIFANGLNIRAEATTGSDILGELQQGDTIQVEPDSRTIDADNEFVWWHHSLGWSAEKSVDETIVYMQEADPALVDEIMAGRKRPEGSPPLLDGSGEAAPAITPFTVDAGEPIDVNALPLRDTLFTRLPVDAVSVDWIQPFGNTTFAFGLSAAADQGTRDSYNYSQGLHGGLDLGYSQSPGVTHDRVVVRAGVHGKVAAPGTAYNPNRVRVNVGADYQIIYGHLSSEVLHPDYVPLNVGDDVHPDTIVGEIAPRAELLLNGISFTPHLHLEIRYLRENPNLILNPYMFLPTALRDTCIAKRNEGYHVWTKWQGDFDQPVIRLAQGIIGPRSELP